MAKATNTTTSTATVLRGASSEKTQEMIRKKAYELYQKRGCTSGNEWSDWFEAERLVKKEMGQWL